MSLRSILQIAVAAVAWAGAGMAHAEAKFAYVDLQRALLETDEGRQTKAKLQAQLDAKTKELEKEQQDLVKEREVLEKQASVMSEDVKNQKIMDFQKKSLEFMQRREKGLQEISSREQSELNQLIGKMQGIISQIAQREQITMVFERNSGVLYAPPSMDLTNELVRLYNDQNKVKATAASAKEPAKSKDAPKKESPPKK
jgi:outer membrane protein